MSLSDNNQTKINNMCPISNEFSIGSRLLKMDIIQVALFK